MLEVSKLIQGDKRTAAKIITLIENDEPGKHELLSQIYPYTGRAHVIGVTGAPGAGKSSLTDELIKQARKNNLKVGVIAVDPTSPISGGALLGDRIRMQEHALDKNVFIRSMGTRGCLGGLARATKDVIKVLDAYGCQVVLIETVGVGQSELDIMHYADTTLVVLTPEAGDHIQTIKAGIMEIADIFVVNKADLGNTKKMITDIEQMLDMSPRFKNGWRPPVLITSTLTQEGIAELWSTIGHHLASTSASGEHQEVVRKRLAMEVMEMVEENLRNALWNYFTVKNNLTELIDQLADRHTDPYSEAQKFVREISDKIFGKEH
ncbi:methylmalonyl Co-A mutase-associated GTPase MeaB [Desulfoscipio geothermicus]|uniref:LAO/AO transport system kinase n=1 Tax=Desulfoscipio geothermicus DSM 3669 TaxID=1121426 RepID=A0A1I6D9B7_9FIRM|nr:methylmalonyl Co-A mutase-associated GTPase MeaB [Desulfoscipio geothermicus]SFR02039.1 LAO/AO transport system kinase [Desulfoscipio geothermicus DSM 3669]